MKIKEKKLVLHEEAPKCPLHNVPMKFEGNVLCDKRCCKYEFGRTWMKPARTHSSYRCPVCFNVYRMEIEYSKD